MEIQELDEAIETLQEVINEFPVGARTPDDFKPIEDRIIDLKRSFKAIAARRLTLNAVVDYGITQNELPGDETRSFKKLNESTTNYLINCRSLKLCYHSQAIQDIIDKNAGNPALQEKVKACLQKLFTLNDGMLTKQERKKELIKKQCELKKECYTALYEYQEFLKESEARRNRQLQEIDPNIIENREKINRSILKINTMKRLITNLIASMSNQLHDNKELLEMLAKHKEIINLEFITELTRNQSQTKN